MRARGLVLAAAVLSGPWALAAPVAPGSATAGKAKRSAGTGVLNLNTASLDQIDALPGISAKVAAAVVAERTARPFSRPEDVMRVRGLSRKRFERLRPHLTVTGATSFVPPAVRPGLGGGEAPRPERPGRTSLIGKGPGPSTMGAPGAEVGTEPVCFWGRSAPATRPGCTTSQDTPPQAMLVETARKGGAGSGVVARARRSAPSELP